MKPPPVKVEVAGLRIDPVTNMPVLILEAPETGERLPVWIGLVEASAIATRLERIETPRPMTHDLLKNALDATGAAVVRVEVSEVRGDTFLAVVELEVAGRRVVVDSRPSDAVALALRAEAPIFIARAVLEAAKGTSLAAWPVASSPVDEPPAPGW